MTQAAMSGVAITLHEAATTGDGLQIAIPPSITKHQLLITGLNTPSAGAVQPECSLDPASSDDSEWATIGGGPITVPDGTIEYNWIGTYKGLRCRISTDITSGEVTVKYIGSH